MASGCMDRPCENPTYLHASTCVLAMHPPPHVQCWSAEGNLEHHGSVYLWWAPWWHSRTPIMERKTAFSLCRPKLQGMRVKLVCMSTSWRRRLSLPNTHAAMKCWTPVLTLLALQSAGEFWLLGIFSGFEDICPLPQDKSQLFQWDNSDLHQWYGWHKSEFNCAGRPGWGKESEFRGCHWEFCHSLACYALPHLITFSFHPPPPYSTPSPSSPALLTPEKTYFCQQISVNSPAYAAFPTTYHPSPYAPAKQFVQPALVGAHRFHQYTDKALSSTFQAVPPIFILCGRVERNRSAM